MTHVPENAAAFLKAVDDAQAADDTLLTWRHPRFREFMGRLLSRYLYPTDVWPPCGRDLPVSRAVLVEMGGFDLSRSLAWLKLRTGPLCDCALVMLCQEYRDCTPEDFQKMEANVRRWQLQTEPSL